MSSWGDSLGGPASRPNLVQGVSVDPKQMVDPTPITYDSFLSGLMLSDAPEDIPASAAVYAVDMEVSRSDELEACPGITTKFTATAPRILSTGLFNQPTIDYTSELVAFDPPYFGYGSYAAGLTWVNAGLSNAGGPFCARTIAGNMIASNGLDVCVTRATGAAVVVDVTAQLKAAYTFAEFAGRTYAGAITPAAGTFQGLGIAWSGSSGTIADFTGANAGAELLIQDIPDADQIMTMLAMGFDTMAILCRRSLWAVYKTGVATRPGDFRPRFTGIGCAARASAAITPGGVTFLGDEGVFNYDLNSTELISRDINAALLPLDTGNLLLYRGAYSQNRQRYYLTDPQNKCLWVYEFPIAHPYPAQSVPGRWIQRNVNIANLLEFSQAGGNPFGAATQMGFVNAFNAGANLFGVEDATTVATPGFTNAGIVQPVWRTGNASKDKITQQFTTVGFDVEYSATIPTILSLQAADSTGRFNVSTSVNKTLPNTFGLLRRIRIGYVSTGMTTGIQISMPSPQVGTKINRITQYVIPSSPSMIYA